eukprot:CAMPEP_0184651626 /NCGR_PEP_ID=MMETSP0308-20130426/9264_1 /TAXON_ID=38269 /ORGANISM="Gloeochaete witrockiana, Strain SAG 46.84" /LENGTH=44 /DNA_ID= /DNA_START= /DNA_END= /DNA_ORIENTATION=
MVDLSEHKDDNSASESNGGGGVGWMSITSFQVVECKLVGHGMES